MADYVLRLKQGSSVAQEFEEDETVHLRDVCFKVEDCIFKVPYRHFEESALFCDLFQLLAKEGITDGVSTDHPLHLKGISKNDFKQLVRFMMDPCLTERKKTLSLPEYTSVLKLSTIWEFEKIRDVIIKEMSALRLDVVERIALAREYNVSQWLLDSLNIYTRSERPLTLKDVNRLGWDCVLKILQARDDDFRYQNNINNKGYDFTVALRSKFGDEIERIEGWNSQETTGHTHQRQFQDEHSFCLVDMFFLVENCLFKGHRQSFEVSPIFRDMFSLPVVENTVPDGSSKEQPLRLDGINRADFKQLLRFMNTNSTHENTFSLPEWTSILKLSTMWEFTDIRQFVISEISKLEISLAERIALARDYYIPQWLLPSLKGYTRRLLTKSVTIEDVNHLGSIYLLRILEVRDEARVMKGYKRHSSWDHDDDFQDEIEKSRTYWSLQKSSTTPLFIKTCRKTVPGIHRQSDVFRPLAEIPPPPYTEIPEMLTRKNTLVRRLFGRKQPVRQNECEPM